jgi:hypothetical protein
VDLKISEKWNASEAAGMCPEYLSMYAIMLEEKCPYCNVLLPRKPAPVLTVLTITWKAKGFLRKNEAHINLVERMHLGEYVDVGTKIREIASCHYKGESSTHVCAKARSPPVPVAAAALVECWRNA